MNRHYHTEGTSISTARVEDILISDPKESENALTRKIMRSNLIENSRDAAASVEITLLHQRRHSKSSPWEDVDAFNLATLKAGQEVRLALSAGQAYRLYQELTNLYALTERGVPRGIRHLKVVDADSTVIEGTAIQIVEALSDHDSSDVLAAFEYLQPDILTAVAVKRQYDLRNSSLLEFQEHLENKDWSEGDWQDFFEKNTWIFGHGLAYQFLDSVTAQPNYGGTLVSGRGGQRGDFLMATSADVRFTVLVEIKKPDSKLLQSKMYRNKVHQIGDELTGGVSQLQSNCRTWVLDGSRQEENNELLQQQSIFTYGPKGILVIGHTEQLTNLNQRATFELFRRNLTLPEIITFDELLARAKYLLAHTISDTTSIVNEDFIADQD